MSELWPALNVVEKTWQLIKFKMVWLGYIHNTQKSGKTCTPSRILQRQPGLVCGLCPIKLNPGDFAMEVNKFSDHYIESHLYE